jgi:hypothetical protein
LILARQSSRQPSFINALFEAEDAAAEELDTSFTSSEEEDFSFDAEELELSSETTEELDSASAEESDSSESYASTLSVSIFEELDFGFEELEISSSDELVTFESPGASPVGTSILISSPESICTFTDEESSEQAERPRNIANEADSAIKASGLGNFFIIRHLFFSIIQKDALKGVLILQ